MCVIDWQPEESASQRNRMRKVASEVNDMKRDMTCCNSLC